MKILVTGRAIPTQPDRCTGQQLAEGFRQAGHECVFYGNFYGQPKRFLGAKEIQETRFDLAVVTEMNDGMFGYHALFNHHFMLKDVPSIYWDFDVSYHPDVSYSWAGAANYDGYLVGNRYFLGADEFGRFGKPVLHLPYACSPQIHRRKPEILKQTVVGFIGSMTAERQSLLANVRCIEGVFGEALIDATNEFYTMVHVNQDACRGLVPGRPWETLGCGTSLLMDRASYEDFIEFIPEYYRQYPTIQVFDSPLEIDRYIALMDSPDARHNLQHYSDVFMKFMHSNHTYKNRAKRIMEWVKEQKIL
jgi:hypothetical protein